MTGAASCSSSGPLPSPKSPVACADLRTLRELGPQLTVVRNPRTGNSLEYTVIGDGADSDQLVVLFNGTGGVLADWPTQMITNVAASPLVAQTDAYDALQNADVALCHSYRLLLFDYAGVGEGDAAIEQTFDSIASDVDALIDDAGQRYRIPNSDISVLGWSLGTHAAMKFAFLSGASVPGRRIHDVVLIATRPGGATDGLATGNPAQCVTEVLDALDQPDLDSGAHTRLDTDGFRLTFPYVAQPPYDGSDSGCNATVDASRGAAEFSVRLDPCLPDTQCARIYADQFENRKTEPWHQTQGVPYAVYINQRDFDQDWNVCYCATPGPDFASEDCSCSEPVRISSTNGGVCQCHIAPNEPETPICSSCVDIEIENQITVLNGYEDLFIQWTYGQELVRAYRAQYGAAKAQIFTYDGNEGAGHGILLQHPRWTQEHIFAALS